MEGLTFGTPDENVITASVVIRRPVREVFGFYRDFTNLPRFLGDVMEVEQLGLALIGKFPAEEASANLNRMKELLETGKVTDTSDAAVGKLHMVL